jgi:hypothetical protein
MNARGRTALFPEILNGVFLRHEEIFSEGICENAVNFLRHGMIETTQAGFDVHYTDAKRCGGQRDGERRIEVNLEVGSDSQAGQTAEILKRIEPFLIAQNSISEWQRISRIRAAIFGRFGRAPTTLIIFKR